MKFPIIVYLGWYLITLLYQIFLQPFYILTSQSLTLYQKLYFSWVNYWDSAHYVSIATQGYRFPQQAFFPLWPLMIKITSFIVGSAFNASFVLSIIFGLSTFVLFYLLATKLVGNNAKYALILFASFPSTFVLHAGYTEGLFLTLTLLSFLLMEKRSYFLSSVFAGFGTMTRMVGVAVSLTYLFLKQPIFKRLILMFISLLGLIVYSLFLQVVFGNGLLFIDAHKAWCEVQGRCQLVLPLIPLINNTQLVFLGLIKPDLSLEFIDWFFTIIFLIILIPVFKKLKFYYFVYSLVTILLPLSSGTMVGMIRFILLTFPVFLIVPQTIKSKLLFFIVCFLLFLLELRLVTLFTNRMWVA